MSEADTAEGDAGIPVQAIAVGVIGLLLWGVLFWPETITAIYTWDDSTPTTTASWSSLSSSI